MPIQKIGGVLRCAGWLQLKDAGLEKHLISWMQWMSWIQGRNVLSLYPVTTYNIMLSYGVGGDLLLMDHCTATVNQSVVEILTTEP